MLRLVAVVVLLCSGCAVLFQEKLDRGWRPEQEPRCSTSQGFAALDLIQAGVDGVIVLQEIDRPEGQQREDVIVVAVVAGLIYAVSAFSGEREIERCRAARIQHDAAVMPRPAVPPVVVPTPPPRQVPSGWCFDTGGDEWRCWSSEERCRAEIEHATAVRGECVERR